MPGIVRDVANYHLRFSNELFGRGSLQAGLHAEVLSYHDSTWWLRYVFTSN
jgi:hypothetical protein